MKMSDNPFTVLGFNADTLRGLSNAQLDDIIEGMRRLQNRIHHPDKHGSKDHDRFLAITEAAQSLGDPTIRRLALEDLLGAAKGKLRKLQDENLSLFGQLDNSYKRLAGFMAAPWRSGSCAGLRSAKLLLYNTIEESRRLQFTGPNDFKGLGIYSTLTITPDGSLSQQWLTAEKMPLPDDQEAQSLIGRQWEAEGSGWEIPTIMHKKPAIIMLHPKPGCTELVDLHLIGVIDSLNLGRATQAIHKMVGHSSEQLGKISQPLVGVPVPLFASLLPMLKPEFEVGPYLVAINDRDEETPRLVILGITQAIAPIDPE